MPRSTKIQVRGQSSARKATEKRAEKRPRQDFITVTMDPALKAAIAEKAERAGVPVARAARILLEAWVGADVLRSVAGKKKNSKQAATAEA